MRVKYFLKSFIGIMIFNMVIFISAGKLNYIEGLTYLLISILGLFFNIITIQKNEDLISERSKPGENIKGWDKKILVLSALLTIISYTIAGLDSGRFHWSPNFGKTYFVLGIILMLIGQIIFLVAKNQNKFFSSVARVQTDREHSVCDIGLYKIVRHPGYIGMIVSWISFPLIMSSIYSIMPVIILIILLIVRTYLEDQMLIEELSGYDKYIKDTKFRLVPFLW